MNTPRLTIAFQHPDNGIDYTVRWYGPEVLPTVTRSYVAEDGMEGTPIDDEPVDPEWFGRLVVGLADAETVIDAVHEEFSINRHDMKITGEGYSR